MSKFIKKLINYAYWRCLDVWHLFLGVVGSIETDKLFKKNLKKKPHLLECELIISLTSYPLRYGWLEKTLKSLINQSIQPDRLILWVAEDDYSQLPSSVLKLQDRGLEVRRTKDLRSYKKLIPTLKEFPNACIITADDDVYYPPNWLGSLLSSWNGRNDQIVGMHGFYVILNENGLPKPCGEWVENPDSLDGLYFMPIGESGILYPPNCFHSDITNENLFQALCPNSDDFWFYWMARLNGTSYIKANSDWRRINWPGSQSVALFRTVNINDSNDAKIKNLLNHYGWQK